MTYYRIADRIQMAALMDCRLVSDKSAAGPPVDTNSRLNPTERQQSESGGIGAQLKEAGGLRERTDLANRLCCSA